ncbi:amino acid ABC transporter permease [Castellaniella sp.]|uniref:amino acid ABC transporter permease n=1 Tax=Castellaniella sp. TaxID=1955812 RepID=UPI002AFF78B0|nr:amino acid ABC transporter permease [Castellaniella sp.]
MDLFREYGPQVLSGFGITVLCWAGAVILGVIIGALIAVVQLFANRWVRAVLRLYIEILRTTPFLVQLFLLYYGGPHFGLALDALDTGVVALAIYGSAYFAEIFRSGFLSVPHGQIEAANCLGISRLHTILRIQLPQMLVIITPALINMIIILSKETSVLSIITVPELTAILTQIGSEQFIYVQTTLILCVCYLLLVGVTQKLGNWAEIRVGHFLQR